MSDITVNNFKAFYEQIRPYLGAVHSGFTPIGTVISVMGTTAPLNYLACDGTIYNISDYTELAAYFNQQFGSSNFFGGDGTTTFAVPDLRGEFLRGTGTNSHANQGSGANVGVHQDGTGIPNIVSGYDGLYLNNIPSSVSIGFENTDGGYKKYASGQSASINFAGKWESTQNNMLLPRPTNTSVLYCIASKNIFMDAGSNYSTEEQVVGTWIDSKPIYQKTINVGTLTNKSTKTYTHNISNIDKFLNINGMMFSSTEFHPIPKVNDTDVKYQVQVMATKTDISIYNRGTDYSGFNCYVTLQYTKTTDA